MKQYKINTKWGATETVYPVIHHYSSNNSLAIELLCNDEGYYECWSFLTVNLINESVLNEHCAFVDTNNNGDCIIDDIIKLGLGKPTGRYGRSGYCIYPEVEFNLNMLNAEGE